MARFVGIEVGTRAIRVVRLSGTGKSLVADLYHEEPIPLSTGGPQEGLRSALESAREQDIFTGGDLVAMSVPSAANMTAMLQLPFDDTKVIEQVLPAQLAGVLPVGDDHVVDFTVIGPSRAEGEEGETLFDVLVSAYPRDLLAARLESLEDAQVDPQMAVPLDLAEHRAARYLMPDAIGVYGVLDIGARTTRLTIMEGVDYRQSRSIMVGGQHISDSIADALGAGTETSEKVKLEYGFVAPAGEELQWHLELQERGSFDDSSDAPDPITMATAVREGLKPLLVALRQTLQSFSTRHRVQVDKLVLAGGGARLRAIAPWLSAELGIDVEPIRFEREELVSIAPNPVANPELLGPLSLALCAAEVESGGININLRKGDLAYKGTLEFLKERAISLAVLAALLLVAFVFMLVMQYRTLAIERDSLKAALGAATSEMFGQELYDEGAIRTELERAKGFSFLPEKSAFDHFEWMSGAVHSQLADVDFEFETLEIDVMRKVVTIKGDTSDTGGVPRIKSVLEQYDCFEEIPEPKTQQARGRVGFQLKIEADACYGATGDEEEE